MEHIPLKFCLCYHQLSECLLAADFKLYLMTSLLKSFSDAATVRTLGGDGGLETSANCHKIIRENKNALNLFRLTLFTILRGVKQQGITRSQ